MTDVTKYGYMSYQDFWHDEEGLCNCSISLQQGIESGATFKCRKPKDHFGVHSTLPFIEDCWSYERVTIIWEEIPRGYDGKMYDGTFVGDSSIVDADPTKKEIEK